jgi:hypothetical protein
LFLGGRSYAADNVAGVSLVITDSLSNAEAYASAPCDFIALNPCQMVRELHQEHVEPALAE